MSNSSISLRRSLRLKRNNIAPATRLIFDSAINQILLKTGLSLRFSNIAGYLANDGEPSISPIIQTRSTCKQPFFLPVLDRKKLKFAHYHWGDPLDNNAFSIPEPTQNPTLPIKFLSAIFMPLVGFDLQGNRIGMGGGYYDRSLHFLRNSKCKKRPLLIGIAYQLQQVNDIKPHAWDIPLDAVVTENGLLCFSNKAKQLLRAGYST
ncbi:MAG: 5-formyltetrahydrofolate cyclo-ligase [Cycloclasticus sp.]|nr:5-formyltetrahydrofolate cyclo-ligase [Cycloclasticus sp.]